MRKITRGILAGALSASMATMMVPGAAFAQAGQGVQEVVALAATAVADSVGDEAPEATSGVFGTCNWSIDSAGVLTIAPAKGSTGELAASWGEAETPLAPWESDKDVTSVVVKPGVVANAVSRTLFRGLTNCKSMDLSGLDTSKVENMEGLFRNCSSLESLDLSSWDTSSATDMAGMFYECASLESLDLSSFDTSKVESMRALFGDCSSLESLDLSGFDTSSATDMSAMFYECASLKSLDLSSFDTSKVEDMSHMFAGYKNNMSLESIAFGQGWDTGKVTNFQALFQACVELRSLDLSGFDTSSAENMGNMFYECSLLKSLDLSGFDTSKVTDMQGMFTRCSALRNLDLSGFDTSKVEDMSWMFERCAALRSVDLSSFDTSKVKDMEGMFRRCDSLESLGLSGFDTSSVENMGEMFQGCDLLASILVSDKWSAASVTESEDMFEDCESLPGFDPETTDATRAYAGVKDGCPGYLCVAKDYMGGVSGVSWDLGSGKWKATSYWFPVLGNVSCKVRITNCKVTTKADGSHVITFNYAEKQNVKPTKKQVHKLGKTKRQGGSEAIAVYDYTTGLDAENFFGAKFSQTKVKAVYGKTYKDADGCKWKAIKSFSSKITCTLPANYKGMVCLGTGGVGKKTVAMGDKAWELPFGSSTLAKGAQWHFMGGLELK